MAYSNTTGLPSVTDIISPQIDTQWFTPEGATRGGIVHAAAAAYLAGAFMPPIEREFLPYLESIRRWIDENVSQVLLVEKRLADPDFGFCGKPDAILVLKDGGGSALVDFKTGLAYAKWWRIQGAAYRYLAMKEGFKTARGLSLRAKPDGSGCLANEWPKSFRNDFNVFLSALNVYNFFHKRS